MKYIEKYLKDIIKVKPLGKLTTEEDELDGISGEMVYIDGKCSNIFISHIDYANWLEKQSENNKSLYIRFGDIPKNEKSKVYNGEIEIGTEKGVSVYPAFEDSEGNIILGLSLPVTKTSLYTQQHLLEYDNRACYLISGDYVGKGTDGEPLLRNIKVIREIKDFRVKQSEQKLADKVKPKFHEGDWVIYNNDICQIVKREEGCNILVTQFGVEKEPVNERNLSTAKLWDISDARDGDVLACESGWTCIFKILNSDNISFSSYCFMDNTGWFCETGSKSHTLEKALIKAYNGEIYPATKEQRDLLFQKMKEAGYIFDFKNKELKKIETEIEIPFGAKDSELQEATYHIPKGFHAEIDDDKVVIKKGGKPTAWSEEDEKMIDWSVDNLSELMHRYGEKYGNVGKCIDWLKSLKDRVGCEANCTSTKEWSESDKEEFQIAIDTLVEAGQRDSAKWLKSLKERIGG